MLVFLIGLSLTVKADDTEKPVFVNITYAGSTEDPEFSSYIGEDQLYFYRNGTNQSEDYMYIRVAITDDVYISNVTLEWKDENGWTNYTMELGMDIHLMFMQMILLEIR